MKIKTLLIALITTLAFSFANAGLPEDDVLFQAITRSANMGFTHKLSTFTVDNSYKQMKKGEKYLVIEYTGVFNLKPEFIGSSTFQGSPEKIKKSGAFAIIKRGSNWYF